MSQPIQGSAAPQAFPQGGGQVVVGPDGTYSVGGVPQANVATTGQLSHLTVKEETANHVSPLVFDMIFVGAILLFPTLLWLIHCFHGHHQDLNLGMLKVMKWGIWSGACGFLLIWLALVLRQHGL